MSGLAGFMNRKAGRAQNSCPLTNDLDAMGKKIAHRGKAQQGVYRSSCCQLLQCSTVHSDREEEQQPIVRVSRGVEGVLVLDGQIWNRRELRSELASKGIHLVGTSDAELLLTGLMEFGTDYLKRVNGVFAFAWWQSGEGTLCLGRDRLGVKPLFYSVTEERIVFASEIKGVLAHSAVRAQIGETALRELLAIGPARIPGHGIFEGIREVRNGCVLTVTEESVRETAYWHLENRPHRESYAAAVLRVRDLLEDSILRELDGDHPTAFLSGGLDSSIVTAVCARQLQAEGKTLDTYSFEFEGSRKYFQSNAFQPSLDSPFAELMVKDCQTSHKVLTCMNSDLIRSLDAALEMRDVPGMADIDASLVYFFGQVSGRADVVLTGEGADEIFGGYPWYHRAAQTAEGFPWSQDLAARTVLLRDDAVQRLDLEEASLQAYRDSVAEMPDAEETQKEYYKKLMWLTLSWFGATLIDRTDRAAMYSGVDARMPFLDYRLVEYLWNTPWEQKAKDGEPKALLRDAVKGRLPEAVRVRKKSPYPKTYHPEYQRALGELLRKELAENDYLAKLLDPAKLEKFLAAPENVSRPWFGQLMAGPQMLAYWLQVGRWLKKYGAEI